MGETKKYKVWLEIEEATLYNGIESTYTPAKPLPSCIGEYNTLKEAKAFVKLLERAIKERNEKQLLKKRNNKPSM